MKTNTLLPELEGRTLPAFPCGLDKKPLTEHGFKDATNNPELFKTMMPKAGPWLFGVPTGEVSGFDVLDIDLKGLVWLVDQEPLRTRWHETRSGGRHYLFNHTSGVRNSASKLAPGVDVRGDGGYIIWWPTCGLSVSNHPIADWPEDLAQQAMSRTHPRSLSMVTPRIVLDHKNWYREKECLQIIAVSSDEEIIEEIHLQLIAESILGVTMKSEGAPLVRMYSREWKFTLQALTKTCFRIGSAQVGTRNSTLNAEAFALGRLMARGWTPPRNFIRALWRGAVRCGLAEDDGVFQTINTIVSGLRAGLADPYPDLEDSH